MTRNVSGYVLAGGLSSRMGTDKALLRLGDTTLLEIALHKVSSVCDEVAILCGSEAHGALLAPFGRVVLDRAESCGPLGGLDAALQDARGERVLIVPADVPLLPSALLMRLMEPDGDVVCFEADGFVQPLPVVMKTSLRSEVASSLALGERKLLPLFHRLGLRVVSVENASVFANVNTPEEFAAVKKVRASREYPG